MTLIEIFTKYVRDKKDLKEYVEKRKTINTRGEFNDKTLRQAADDLLRLKKENPEIYEKMYKTLDEYYMRDEGHTVEYPIDFIRQILKIYQQGIPAEKVYECYKKGLNHSCRDA
jgi:predicted nuclease with TOPRIM domain